METQYYTDYQHETPINNDYNFEENQLYQAISEELNQYESASDEEFQYAALKQQIKREENQEEIKGYLEIVALSCFIVLLLATIYLIHKKTKKKAIWTPEMEMDPSRRQHRYDYTFPLVSSQSDDNYKREILL